MMNHTECTGCGKPLGLCRCCIRGGVGPVNNEAESPEFQYCEKCGPFVNCVCKQPATLQKDLAALLNCHCAENGSDTPDSVLAQYLTDSLAAFDKASKAREAWYGAKLEIGHSLVDPSKLFLEVSTYIGENYEGWHYHSTGDVLAVYDRNAFGQALPVEAFYTKDASLILPQRPGRHGIIALCRERQ